ncbi:hypothetical protein GFS31_22470 [Leptolyngbya sp. BL0902]|nr:hypothetical protein GFS31_22470 [Leptolyngbya sp. BL0902]
MRSLLFTDPYYGLFTPQNGIAVGEIFMALAPSPGKAPPSSQAP